jgi:rubrerythrin
MASRQTTSGSRRQDSGRKQAQRPARRPAAQQRKEEGQEVDREVFEELLLQALETERGGIQVYETAVSCAQNEELKEEWEEYLEQTRNHERILMEYFSAKGLDPEEETTGRAIVRTLGETLVQAMEQAKSEEPDAAECTACECVVLAETKDHMNWQLLRECAEALDDDELREACDEVEDQEDEHLYHTMGWTREIWLDGLGLGGQFPPPEEEKDVRSMAAAGRAAQGRKEGGGKAGKKR